MKNFIKSGIVSTVTVGADIESGRPLEIGGLIGVSTGKFLNGEVGEFQKAGVFEFAKAGTLAIVQGTQYAWDDTAKAVVATTTGDFELGLAEEDELAATLTCKILVNGLPGIAL